MGTKNTGARPACRFNSRKIKAAVKSGQLEKAPPAQLVTPALEAGILTADEAELVARAEEARNEAIQVDSFGLSEYLQHAVSPTEDTIAEPETETAKS